MYQVTVPMTEDAELLNRYVDEKSEDAFAELVGRHLDFVYGVALRRVGGNGPLAEDVAQGVFTDLARKAKALARHPALSAWLFRSARFAAAQAVRSERRRVAREQEAHLMHDLTHSSMSNPDWDQVRSVIDDVIDELPERDRVAVGLRFFEGRTFAEVGAKLAASEDAVRVRVDRALEKMRRSLARRGVASTTAALSAALAQGSGVAAPTGFAASVAGSALASVAAGGGIAAGLGLSTFMSTSKLGAWSAAALLLCASLAGNAYMMSQSLRESVAPISVAAVEVKPATTTSAASFSLVKDDVNLAALRDQLRTSGANESSIRATLEGILRRRYREKLSADRVERTRWGWWRDPMLNLGNPEAPIQFTEDQRLLRETVTIPLEQLLGPDPLAVAETEAKYAYLPSELRQAFGRLDRDVPPTFLATGRIEVDGPIEAELARQRSAVDQQRKELVASLAPAQRADWEMRNSPLATNLVRQFEPLGVTEAEYRGIFPLADNYAKTNPRSVRPPEGADFNALNEAATQQMMQQLVSTFGYDRALDFIWSGAAEYGPYARVLRDTDLPISTAGRVMQLAAETAKHAATVHGDETLSLEQKRAALVALQQRVRPELDALLPAEVQQRLAPTAQAWLPGLSQGNSTPIAGSLPGASGIMITFARSIDNPPPAASARVQTLPTRPPAN